MMILKNNTMILVMFVQYLFCSYNTNNNREHKFKLNYNFYKKHQTCENTNGKAITSNKSSN